MLDDEEAIAYKKMLQIENAEIVLRRCAPHGAMVGTRVVGLVQFLTRAEWCALASRVGRGACVRRAWGGRTDAAPWFVNTLLNSTAVKEMRCAQPAQYWQLLERRRHGLPVVDDVILFRSLVRVPIGRIARIASDGSSLASPGALAIACGWRPTSLFSTATATTRPHSSILSLNRRRDDEASWPRTDT